MRAESSKTMIATTIHANDAYRKANYKKSYYPDRAGGGLNRTGFFVVKICNFLLHDYSSPSCSYIFSFLAQRCRVWRTRSN